MFSDHVISNRKKFKTRSGDTVRLVDLLNEGTFETSQAEIVGQGQR